MCLSKLFDITLKVFSFKVSILVLVDVPLEVSYLHVCHAFDGVSILVLVDVPLEE